MPTVAAAPTFERQGVVTGFVLSRNGAAEIIGMLIPAISAGVLFAQGEMYRTTAPIYSGLPWAPANQQSWLFYNSVSGFYWRSTFEALAADDAFIGWVVTGTERILLFSSQQIPVGEAQESTAIIPMSVVQPAGVSSTCPNVQMFRAGHSNGDGTFDLEMYWNDARTLMLFDWGCLAPGERSNWLGLQIWIKRPAEGGGYRYTKATGTIGIDQFEQPEPDGRIALFAFLPVELADVPEIPENWTLIAASVNRLGEINTDLSGNPNGPTVTLATLGKNDYAEDFAAEIVKQGTEPGEELWGVSATWTNPSVPRYVKTRIMLLGYGDPANVQQLSGDNPLTDLSSINGFWPWPETAQSVICLIQSIFGDGTVADLEDCPHVHLTVSRTLGSAGQENCGLVTGLTWTPNDPSHIRNADGQRVLAGTLSWTPPANDASYKAASLWMIRDGTTHIQLPGLEYSQLAVRLADFRPAAESVIFYALSVNQNLQRNTYIDGVTPHIHINLAAPPTGAAGSEYTSQVTGFGVAVSEPAQADGTAKKIITVTFTRPALATDPSWGALSIQLKPAGGAFGERIRGSVSPIIFEIPFGVSSVTYTVGGFGVDVNGRVNTYQAGVTPTVDIIVGTSAGQLDLTKVKATSIDGVFSVDTENGKFIIIPGGILTSHLDTDGIDVGGGSGKPGQLRVWNAAGTQIGYIGVDGTDLTWLKSLGIGGTSKTSPSFTASPTGVVSVVNGSIRVTGTYEGEEQTVLISPSDTYAPLRVYGADGQAVLVNSASGVGFVASGSAYAGPYIIAYRNASGSYLTQYTQSAAYAQGGISVDMASGYGKVRMDYSIPQYGVAFVVNMESSTSARYMDLVGLELRLSGTKVLPIATIDPTVHPPSTGSNLADGFTGDAYNSVHEIYHKLIDLMEELRAGLV